MTLSEAVPRFLSEKKLEGFTLKTIDWYQGCLDRFAGYLEADFDLSVLDLSLLSDYYTYLSGFSLSGNSVQTYFRGLRVFLSWAFQRGYMSEDLPRSFRLPKGEYKEIVPLSDQELQRLFQSFDLCDVLQLRNFVMCCLMFDSGLRLNEVITLCLSSLRLDEGFLVVSGKGKKQRRVPLGSLSVSYLRRYLKFRPCSSSDRVFVQLSGLPITFNTCKSVFRRLKISSGIPRLHAHLLRHTFATRFLDSGGDIYQLRQILGHTDLSVTMRYLHLSDRRMIETFEGHSPLSHLDLKMPTL